MIPADGAKLVEDFALMLPSGSLITVVNPTQILRFCFDTHCRCLGNHDYESTNRLTLCQACLPGNIYCEAMRLPTDPKMRLDPSCAPGRLSNSNQPF